MASKRSLARSVPAAVLALVSGCALTINPPDPDRPRNEIPRCDAGKGAVGLDAVASAMFGLGSIAAFADGEEGTGLALGAIGGLFVASAIRGNTSANACRAAYGEYNVVYQQMLRQEPARPRPAVARKPPPVELAPAPVAGPIETLEPAPVVEAPQIPRPEQYGTPRPPPAKKPPPPAPTEPTDEDWSAFWREAP